MENYKKEDKIKYTIPENEIDIQDIPLMNDEERTLSVVNEHYHKVDQINYVDLWNKPVFQYVYGATITDASTAVAHTLGRKPNFIQIIPLQATAVGMPAEPDGSSIYLICPSEEAAAVGAIVGWIPTLGDVTFIP